MPSRRIPFDYTLHYAELNLRKNPELYRVGKGEQGVLLVEPYKSEILPHWRFATPEIATESAEAIRALFEDYRKANDFVGMDMCRKFLQMGYTRSRRYANMPVVKNTMVRYLPARKDKAVHMEEQNSPAKQKTR